jgi:hypothetical protein
MAHRASDVETLLPTLHQLARDFERNTCPPIVAHFAGVVIIGANTKADTRMRLEHLNCGGGGGRRSDRFGFRHLVANRKCAGDGQTGAAPIGKKIEWRLCAHFHLAHHVRKNLER